MKLSEVFSAQCVCGHQQADHYDGYNATTGEMFFGQCFTKDAPECGCPAFWLAEVDPIAHLGATENTL